MAEEQIAQEAQETEQVTAEKTTEATAEKTLEGIRQAHNVENASNIVDETVKSLNEEDGNTTDKLDTLTNQVTDLSQSLSGDNSRIGKAKAFISKQKTPDIDDVKKQIQNIFDYYEKSRKSLQATVNSKKPLLGKIDSTMNDVINYREDINNNYNKLSEEEQSKSKVVLNQLDTLQVALEDAKQRVKARLDTAENLILSMDTNRPVYEAILSIALLENIGQTQAEESVNLVDNLGQIINKMTSDLTKRTIETSKRVENQLHNGGIDGKVLIDNMKKIESHNAEIQNKREAFRDGTTPMKQYLSQINSNEGIEQKS